MYQTLVLCICSINKLWFSFGSRRPYSRFGTWSDLHLRKLIVDVMLARCWWAVSHGHDEVLPITCFTSLNVLHLRLRRLSSSFSTDISFHVPKCLYPISPPNVFTMPEPQDAPPSYDQATHTGSSKTSTSQPTHLNIPHNGIPADRRRSMEDELRPLPKGWIRQFDKDQNHQFFVDTSKDPPHSIWHHPYDDDEYLSTLTSEERERIQEEEHSRRRPLTPSTVDEDHDEHQGSPIFDRTQASFLHVLVSRDRPQLSQGRRRASGANSKTN